MKTVYHKFGFEKTKELVKIVKETLTFGDTQAFIIDTEKEILSLCEYLKVDEVSILNFIQRFIFRKSLINGIDWVFKLFEMLKESGYSDHQLARIFIQVKQSKNVWDFIDKTSSETQKSYWKGIYPQFRNVPEDDFIFGIDKLIEVGRFISALEITYHKREKVSTEKLAEILEKAGTERSEEEKTLRNHYVTSIIEEIGKREGVDRSVLLRLEWLYLPFLASYGSSHKPKLLHEELANNPDFFIEVLSWVYKSDNEEEDISDETKQNKGKNAYELLCSWKQIPGVDKNGKIDEEFLWNWINRVKELAEQSGRLEVAYLQLGQVLAEYPEKEEPWPPREICKVLESINTQRLMSGFSSATFNKRGSSTRGVFEGGDIERGHAQYFRAQAEKIKYEFPETAKILTHLAECYEAGAKLMDEKAERDKLDS